MSEPVFHLAKFFNGFFDRNYVTILNLCSQYNSAFCIPKKYGMPIREPEVASVPLSENLFMPGKELFFEILILNIH